jgi:hypothetical protein
MDKKEARKNVGLLALILPGIVFWMRIAEILISGEKTVTNDRFGALMFVVGMALLLAFIYYAGTRDSQLPISQKPSEAESNQSPPGQTCPDCGERFVMHYTDIAGGSSVSLVADGCPKCGSGCEGPRSAL